MNSMELELQTRFRFSLNIKPPFGAAKQRKGAQYKSCNYDLGETDKFYRTICSELNSYQCPSYDGCS